MALLWAYLITGNKSPKLIQVLVPFFTKWCQSLKNCWRKGKQWPCHQTWKIKSIMPVLYSYLFIAEHHGQVNLPIPENLVLTWPYTERTTVRPHHRHTNEKVGVVCDCSGSFGSRERGCFFDAKKNGRRVLLSINNLEVQPRQLRTKRNYFFRIGWQKFFLHSYFLEFSFIVSSSLEYRERERKSKRESRRQASQTQRERERERATERRRNWTDEQRKTEQERNRERRSNFTDEPGRGSKKESENVGAILLTCNRRESEKESENGGAMLLACNRRESKKESENGGKILLTRNGQKSKKEQGKGDTISLKSNWRINEREQEKIDAELATSSEEWSKRQQRKSGIVQTRVNRKGKVNDYLQIWA